jgi:hypothetical protein
MSLTVFQPLCVAVLAIAWWAMAQLRAPRRLVVEYLAIAAAAWIGEESCIRLYRFYGYSKCWALHLDAVPLLVPLIWPLVILSAREVGHAVGVPARRLPLWVFAQVSVDASLVEIIAVQAGFWVWSEGGYYDVPPIGILGWGFFAAGAIWAVERKRPWLALLTGPLAAHAGLLASWWGLLRWVGRGELGPRAWVAVVAFGGIATLAALRFRARVPLAVMAPRMIAAGLFVAVLLGLPAPLIPYVAHTIAIAAPYLVLTRVSSPRQVHVGREARA